MFTGWISLCPRLASVVPVAAVSLAMGCFEVHAGVANTRGEWRLENSFNEQADIADMLELNSVSPSFQTETIGGEFGTFLAVPLLGSSEALVVPHHTGVNGGFNAVPAVNRTNNWTLVLDLRFGETFDSSNDRFVINANPILQTDPGNSDAAELEILPDFGSSDDADGGIVFQGQLLTAADGIARNTWIRIAFTCERISETQVVLTTFVDGQVTGSVLGAAEGVLSLDPDSLLLFTSDVGSPAGLDVACIGFWAQPLAAADVEALGTAEGGGIFDDVTVFDLGASGTGTLADAVANATTPTRIRFEQMTAGGTIAPGAEIPISDVPIIIDGSDVVASGGIAITGSNTSRILAVDAENSASLIDIGLLNGFGDCFDRDNPQPGGAIFNGGELSIFGNSGFVFNSSCFGGAIFNTGALELRRTASGTPTFIGNFADYSGGAIYNNDGASLDTWGVLFGGVGSTDGNVAYYGGAVFNDEASAYLQRAVFRSNSATDGGGGIDNRGTAVLTECDFEGNFSGEGGAVANRLIGESNNSDVPVLNVDASSFINNFADFGGAIFNFVPAPGFTQIVNSTIDFNSAFSEGGGILNLAGSTFVLYSTVTRNSAATGAGPGIASLAGLADAQTIVLNSIVAENNTSGSPGIVQSDVDLVGDPADGISFQSLDGNIVGTGSGVAAFSGSSDQAGVLDAQLGPLQTALGTQSRGPNPGSPAIDAGVADSSTPLFDQRGSDRVLNSVVDIGSVEFDPVSNPSPITTITPVGTDPSSGLFMVTVGWDTTRGSIYQLECSQSLDFSNPITMGPMTGNGDSHSMTLALRPGSEFVRVRTLQQ